MNENIKLNKMEKSLDGYNSPIYVRIDVKKGADERSNVYRMTRGLVKCDTPVGFEKIFCGTIQQLMDEPSKAKSTLLDRFNAVYFDYDNHNHVVDSMLSVDGFEACKMLALEGFMSATLSMSSIPLRVVGPGYMDAWIDIDIDEEK